MKKQNYLGRYIVLKCLFDSKCGDTLRKGMLLTIDEVGIDLDTGAICLVFEEEHDLGYDWNEDSFEIVGFKLPDGKIAYYES